MAPITQETVDGLKDTIAKLESRVVQLEDRLVHGGNESKSKSVAEQMRLILMGPPGAGAFLCRFYPALIPSYMHFRIGKGTQAPRIKEKFCVCHLVSVQRARSGKFSHKWQASGLTQHLFAGYRRHAAIASR
jgi:adenylate kinase